MKNANMIMTTLIVLMLSLLIVPSVKADIINDLTNYFTNAMRSLGFPSLLSIFSSYSGILYGQAYQIDFTCPSQAVNPVVNGVQNVVSCSIVNYDKSQWNLTDTAYIGGAWSSSLNCQSSSYTGSFNVGVHFTCNFQCIYDPYNNGGFSSGYPQSYGYRLSCGSSPYVVQNFAGTCSGSFCTAPTPACVLSSGSGCVGTTLVNWQVDSTCTNKTISTTLYSSNCGYVTPITTTCPNNQVSLNGICQNNLFTVPPVNCPTGTVSQNVGSNQYSCVQLIASPNTTITAQPVSAQLPSNIPTIAPSTILPQSQKSIIDLIIGFFQNFFKSLIS